MFILGFFCFVSLVNKSKIYCSRGKKKKKSSETNVIGVIGEELISLASDFHKLQKCASRPNKKSYR